MIDILALAFFPACLVALCVIVGVFIYKINKV